MTLAFHFVGRNSLKIKKHRGWKVTVFGGRIHVSQATADLLTAAGKKHWLTAREDMIEAKGKGKDRID
jgi:hypothetical protein